MAHLQGPAWVGMVRAGSSATNVGKAAEILLSECGRKENESFVWGDAVCEQPSRCSSPAMQRRAASCADGGHGDSFEEGDKEI